MSGEPSTSRERIIPIQMEDNNFIENKSPSARSSASTSTSHTRVIPVQMETNNSFQEDKEKDSITHQDSSFSGNGVDSSTKEIDTEVLKEVPIKRSLPMFNVKEKIILVVDSAEDENVTPFRFNNAQKCKPFDMLKHAIEIFLHNKSSINKKHEYALAVMNEHNVLWTVDFTNNINDILNGLQGVVCCETEDIFPLNALFDVILKNVSLPEVREVDGTILPPSYVIRTILLYGRSYTMPKLQETEEIEWLLKSPYFTLDVLITHEPADDNNNCNKIFNVLQNLDQKGFAYFCTVERDSKTLFNSMGKLLGHPLQRPPQQLADYSIKTD